MARTKTFEPQKALDAAVEVFWVLGYENASLDVLLSAMGIAKQSMYDTFGDKRALFLLAMREYRRITTTAMRRRFATAPSVRDGFASLLYGMAAETPAEHARGCLLLSANLQRAAEDEEIAQFLRDNQEEVESIFVEALQRAKGLGELPPDAELQPLARYFIVTVQGLRAMAKLQSDREALEQVAKIALGVFS